MYGGVWRKVLFDGYVERYFSSRVAQHYISHPFRVEQLNHGMSEGWMMSCKPW